MNRSNTPSIASWKSLRRSLGRKVCWSTLAVTLAVSAQLDAAPPELKTQGNQIVVKSTGAPVRLTGVNLSGLEDNNINLNLLNSLEVGVKTWKSNVFRLPVKHTYWSGSTATAYKAQVDEFIARASELNVYVILDLHDYLKTKTAHATFWSDAANRYKNNPAVLFGLLNEPHGTGWDVWRNGDSEGPGMQGLLNAVRATGANNIVLAGGGDWGYNLSGILNGYALTDTSSGNGVVYDSHVYPWKSYIQRDVGNVALVYPVLLGEFGHPGGTTYPGQSSFETDTTWVPRMMDWVNTNNLHWTGWCFSPNVSPLMILDWSYEPTEYWGEAARSHLQSYADPTARRVVGGTVIGTPGTRSNPTSGVITDYQRGAVAPFGNSYAYYFDAPTASGGWTGLDLVTPHRITQIKYMPRKDNGHLMVGGVFQASNSATFSSGVVTLYTVATEPNDTFVGNIGNYTIAQVSNTNSYRYVRYVGPANSYSNVAAIRFYTGDDSGPGVNDDVIIIDNGGTGSTVEGTWSNASNYGFHGTRWVSDGNSEKGDKSIRYTPKIMQDGLYEVFTIWSSHATSRDTAVPYTITHAGTGSPEVVRVNQRENGGSWQSLGTFPFAAGDTGNVLISNAGTTNYIVADAVKFVYKPQVEIVMDKGTTDGSGITTTGAWASSTGAPNYYGDRFFHDGNSDKGNKSVRFTPSITAAGQYTVYAWWTTHANRATNTPITVNHANGSVTTRVNQEQNGGQWYPLGTYTFNAGSSTTAGSVLITNDANEYVVVDAVRFLRVGD